jgi:hypothetical protein
MKDHPKNKSKITGINEAGGDDTVLLAQLSSLPSTVSPGNDPWVKIEQRILASKAEDRQAVQPQSRAWLAVAASLMLVAVSVLFVVQNSVPTHSGTAPLAEGAPDHDSASVNHHASLLNERGARIPALSIELQYQAAFREFRGMEVVADLQPMEMDAGLVLGWEEMQKVESALKLALDQEPGNSMLVHRLAKLRARQLQFLHSIADSGMAPGSNLI